MNAAHNCLSELVHQDKFLIILISVASAHLLPSLTTCPNLNTTFCQYIQKLSYNFEFVLCI